MAFTEIKNVVIRGIAAAVPERKEFNKDFPKLSEEQLQQYIKTVGVIERRCAIHDGTLCTSDLCYAAAEKLLGELGWNREEIGLLVFVSHTQDYKLPSTACILQARLGLSKEAMAFDVPLGCSGFVYGLGIVGSIVSQGTIKKALLLVGNTQSVMPVQMTNRLLCYLATVVPLLPWSSILLKKILSICIIKRTVQDMKRSSFRMADAGILSTSIRLTWKNSMKESAVPGSTRKWMEVQYSLSACSAYPSP